mmetsp:Transcript_15096/g.37201  ORF Transcript_15096/g.37201 Transcript_15096/m.37201 type:complete len:942 (-) Transcript_15096:1725-4550(-)|eukprot:CAMPEP_0113481072 /NCGR_PEP_ID=MMETSP0014_2-20120614/22216_1 /TAXON_ID=2857 /ORGANISM="Nitzschia sp." /LENGTH=941 /DNA_ID=CAMNT_0000374549 /DNA_START=206 /DNA_END=3031 /DNA_ORIENTATION=+ /assembly_acc=CAM_ASM_000159
MATSPQHHHQQQAVMERITAENDVGGGEYSSGQSEFYGDNRNDDENSSNSNSNRSSNGSSNNNERWWKISVIRTRLSSDSIILFLKQLDQETILWGILVVWKVLFAIVAVMDVMTCWNVISNVMVTTTSTGGPDGGGAGGRMERVCPAPFPQNNGSSSGSGSGSASGSDGNISNFSSTLLLRQSTCAAINYVHAAASSSMIHGQHMHILFCTMCLVEMIIRAREARQIALQNDAVAKFEATLQGAYSATRMYASQSFAWNAVRASSPSLSSPPNRNTTLQQEEDDDDEEDDKDAYRLPTESLRLWIPVGVTCFFWFALLPSNLSEYRWNPTALTEPLCGTDSSILHIWVTTSLLTFIRRMSDLQNQIVDVLWEEYLMPYNFISQPRRFWKRVRVILRAIKLVRFAFPLARMSMKVGDQLYALFRTWRQSHTVVTEREKRIRRPSLLWNDLQRVESMAKGLTGLASLPSRLFDFGTTTSSSDDGSDDNLPTPTPSPMNANSQRQLIEQRHHGRSIKRRLKRLKRELSKTMSHFSAADLYDKLQTVRESVVNASSRSVAQHSNSMVSTFLSSRDLLLSPRSRFSVVWRITVTNCLLLELSRLAISWNLTKTFRMSITQIISQLTVHCDRPKDTQNHFRFITDRVDDIHKAMSNAIPLIPRPQEKWLLCVPTSFSARTFLFFGYWLESFIDVVSFVDIFIWFFTGSLDERGVIVPKGFLYRCIIPGTLTQFLDHPTLPGLLPSLLQEMRMIAEAVGWGRWFRWVFAIFPALLAVIVYPMTAYFFSHFDDLSDESKGDLLMSYAESFGYLPGRPISRNFSAIGLDYDGDDWSPLRRPKPKLSLSHLSTPPPRPFGRSSANPARNRVPSLARTTPDNDDAYDEGRFLRRGFNSAVRFDNHVASYTIMERMDSVQSSDDGPAWEDDSTSYDVGLNLSTRDFQPLHEE